MKQQGLKNHDMRLAMLCTMPAMPYSAAMRPAWAKLGQVSHQSQQNKDVRHVICICAHAGLSV